MLSLTAGVTLLRWPLTSAVLMFVASTLKIKLRKAGYIGLGAICSMLGLAAACWFATSLLGITMVEISTITNNIKDVMVEVMSQTPPEWPVALY